MKQIIKNQTQDLVLCEPAFFIKTKLTKSTLIGHLSPQWFCWKGGGSLH